HDREIEQIARENEEARALPQRRGIRKDHLPVCRLSPFEVHRLRSPGAGERGALELAGIQQLPHDRGDTAGAMEAFAQICTCWLHVDQQWNVVAMLHPVAGTELDSGVA